MALGIEILVVDSREGFGACRVSARFAQGLPAAVMLMVFLRSDDMLKRM
jgi:hypothetical protein